MDMVNNGFGRYFMIFVQEDKGFGINNGPAGHLKIEIRNRKGNLTAWVDNFKEMHDKYKYKLYLLSISTKSDVVYTGRIYIKGNNGQLNWDFNPFNVSGTGLPFKNFNTAVIIAEDIQGNADERILCPLASYRNGKTNWRGIFERYKSNKHTKTVVDNSMTVNKSIDNKKEITQNTYDNKNTNYHSTKRLTELFDSSFIKYMPFNTNRKDYTWWKVDSPVVLNNILYQFNIKTPLLFNPTVMKAYFKYKHLIAGLYTDISVNREYLIFGIPGNPNEYEKPFGNISKWIKVDTNKTNLSIYGYWLIYTDIKNGKLLNLI
jgi:hypothetical protein